MILIVDNGRLPSAWTIYYQSEEQKNYSTRSGNFAPRAHQIFYCALNISIVFLISMEMNFVIQEL
jgi:hypothetical protein